MSDLICRKTMRRCETQSMCSPYGGCFEPYPQTTPGADQAAALTTALRTTDWRNVSVGNKALVQSAITVIEALQQENERLTRHLQALPEHIWDQYIGGPRP